MEGKFKPSNFRRLKLIKKIDYSRKGHFQPPNSLKIYSDSAQLGMYMKTITFLYILNTINLYSYFSNKLLAKEALSCLWPPI